MKFEAMFQPVKIGNMTVPNRFVMSPMGNYFANTDLLPSVLGKLFAIGLITNRLGAVIFAIFSG